MHVTSLTEFREAHLVYFVCIVCIIVVQSKDLIRLLTAAGWYLRSTRGSHHVFVHPLKKGHLSVPHPKKDLGTGLLQKILKIAGIEDRKI